MRAFGKVAILCAAALAMATQVQADNHRPTGTYLGGGLGANFAGDNDVSGGSINTSIDHDTGFAGVLALGQSYANGLRGEFEFARRANGVDSVGSTTTGGKTSVLSGMINGYYDFATGTSFIPYLGAGIGIGQARISANPVGNTALASSGSGLALQGIAGIGYQMDDNWTGTIEYRYFNLQGVDINTRAGGSVDADYDSHAIMVGLRYTFGVEKKPMAEPAPAPAPAPAPVVEKKPEPAPAPPAPPPVARNYIVFFDWDKSDITGEAMAILKTAAENARKGGISRIEATGHADTSGTKAYNLKLSERRARAVQAVLNQLGVASNEIAIDWKGELQPLVPTADGVREPQNRRVEIVFP